MKQSVLALYSEVVAKSEVLLSSARGDASTQGVRNSEQALGNIVADAMKIIGGADVAVTNGGGLRADIRVGSITRGDLNAVLPFGNYLVIKEVTPKALKEIMENGLQFAPGVDGRFPQISGMDVVYDQEKPAGQRVVSITINGNKLDLTAKTTIYKLATHDFMANGGDGYTAIAGLATIAELDSLDVIFERYIISLPNSTITAANAKIDGRIRIYEPEITVPTVSSASNAKFISIKETTKNVWTLTFTADVKYSDGSSKTVQYAVNLSGNNANLDGKYQFENGHDLTGYTLVYDIKGNGSNIKEFKLTK
jgi:hypothetical protein